MAEKGEIVFTLSTPHSDPLEFKIDVGESFQDVLQELTRAQDFLPELTESLREFREFLQTAMELVEVLGEYRQDLRNLLETIKILGESRKDFQNLLSLARNFKTTKET